MHLFITYFHFLENVSINIMNLNLVGKKTEIGKSSPAKIFVTLNSVVLVSKDQYTCRKTPCKHKASKLLFKIPSISVKTGLNIQIEVFSSIHILHSGLSHCQLHFV